MNDEYTPPTPSAIEGREGEKLTMVEIPRPTGDFILAQKDIPFTQATDGAYWHYKDVITLLHRYTSQHPQQQAGREAVQFLWNKAKEICDKLAVAMQHEPGTSYDKEFLQEGWFDWLRDIVETLRSKQLPAPSSVSNPVAFAEWLGVEGWRAYASDPKYYRKDGESPKTPADLYALFTSQHGEQETNQEKLWEGVIHCILTNNKEGAKALCLQHYHITPKNKQQ